MSKHSTYFFIFPAALYRSLRIESEMIMNRNRFMLIVITVLLCACGRNEKGKVAESQPAQREEGMVWIPGGEFVMGTDDPESYEHERPAHRVKIDGFWMDATEVTNEQFRSFVKATGYITLAERTPEWEDMRKQLPPGTAKPHDSVLVAGSLVFHAPDEPVLLNDYSQWWKWLPGADWKHPEGPGSDLEGRWNHPVVHIAYDDALAYCQWAGKRLPTEAEWEFASRGGREQERYGWGNELTPQGRYLANTFQGSFPSTNLQEDGFEKTSPVKSFPPNAYGLYDIIGNVWEWTSDWYDVNYYKTLGASPVSENPQGPASAYDPNEPYAHKRVSKGGSYLCASNYCVNYRPSARQGTAFDSGMSNLGFRCVK
jgi:formylglycine-generating enzyme required for sulfatase activity